jgi:hypothetical protein
LGRPKPTRVVEPTEEEEEEMINMRAMWTLLYELCTVAEWYAALHISCELIFIIV